MNEPMRLFHRGPQTCLGLLQEKAKHEDIIGLLVAVAVKPFCRRKESAPSSCVGSPKFLS